MSQADEAYAYAEAIVEQALRTGAKLISLDPQAHSHRTSALDRIPRNISKVPFLEELDVRHTKVRDLQPLSNNRYLLALYCQGTEVEDLSPVSKLTELRVLALGHTNVSDLRPIRSLKNIEKLLLSDTKVINLEPLSSLTAIKELDLDNTKVKDIQPLRTLSELRELGLRHSVVSDIEPLSNLQSLRIVDIESTPLADLSPLMKLPALRRGGWREYSHLGGVFFRSTAATRVDPELTLISRIDDNWYRTQQLLDYLEAQQSKLPPKTTGERPAPLMVQTNADGALEPSPTPIDLTADAEERAQQAWDALKIYIGEIEDLTERIHNRMPRLGKSLDSLKRAMGDDFAAMNQIDLGMQGDRVVRLSVLTGDILLEEDAVEVQAFAAQTALYLRRFNTWETYKDDSPPDAETVQHVREDRQDFKDLRDGLETEALATEGVLAALDDLIEEGTEAESDPLAARGLLDSEVNVLDALAEQAIAAKTEAGENAPGFLDDLHEQSTAKFRDKILDNVVVAGGVAALTYFFTHKGPINKLAARYPDRFAYLTTVLHWLFG